MIARAQEILEEASANFSPEETRDLAEMLFELYEDEMDNRAADEALRQLESGEETTVSWEDYLAQKGLKPGFSLAIL